MVDRTGAIGRGNPGLGQPVGKVGGFHGARGVPQARWWVFVRENPNLQWMMTWGTPIFSATPKIHGDFIIFHISVS